MIYILFGKSASGKDLALNLLVSEYDFTRIISTTSRPMREGERPGIDYHFKTRTEFEEMIAENKLIEYRSYNTSVNGIPDTWYYGVEKQEFDPNIDYIAVTDITGLEAFISIYGKENIKTCYIDVSDEIRENRAKIRRSFDQTEWNRRLIDDAIKFTPDKIRTLTENIVVNENLSEQEFIKEVVRKITKSKLSSVDDDMLFKRLDKIDDELKDFHISAYKADMLYKEQRRILREIKYRGYKKWKH